MKHIREPELADIAALIDRLSSRSDSEREQARLALISMGNQSTPFLVRVLMSSTNFHARWEAAQALRHIKDPDAGATLVLAMKDERVGIRWIAVEALIALGEDAIRPILEGLTRDFSSVLMLEGAHHVLHAFHDQLMLNELERRVYEALNQPASGMTVPWAAAKALEALDREETYPKFPKSSFTVSGKRHNL